uniref:Uncharacterized protein n=1 Tax=Brassica oleracea var. oleracea TaxID=109376 RepID=A0A0D3B3R8_BRAOL
MAATAPWDLSCHLDVNFKTEQHAFIAYTSLAVDKELQPDKVRRVMSVSTQQAFCSVEARLLRASFSAFVDVLTLATRTIREYGQD